MLGGISKWRRWVGSGMYVFRVVAKLNTEHSHWGIISIKMMPTVWTSWNYLILSGAREGGSKSNPKGTLAFKDQKEAQDAGKRDRAKWPQSWQGVGYDILWKPAGANASARREKSCPVLRSWIRWRCKSCHWMGQCWTLWVELEKISFLKRASFCILLTMDDSI